MFESFVQKALAQDKRNCFSPYDGPVDFIPDAFQAFYRDTDPIDVEIRSGAYGSVRFFPAAELQQQQEAYEVTPEMFVFASVNGDPIFLSDGVVYTYAHGCKGVPWECSQGSFFLLSRASLIHVTLRLCCCSLS